MTDEYIDRNKVSNPTINDTTSFVSQNDHSTMNQTASSHENMVENRKSTVGDSNSAFNDTVGNTAKDDRPGMVNRRQSTFDSTGNLSDYVADCKERKIEDNEGRSNRFVDRNKATVEDTATTSSFHIVDGLVNRNKDTVETTVGPRTPDSDSNLVDRDKATVEDTVATSSDQIVEGVVVRNQATVEDTVGIQTRDGGSNLVDRDKATVEDTVATSSDYIVDSLVDSNKVTVGTQTHDGDSNLVDRDKATVEDPVPTSSHQIVDDLVDRSKAIVEDAVGTQTHDGGSNLVDRDKATVEDIVTTSSDQIGEGVVDRNKVTVEETVGTSLTGHVVGGDKSKDDDLIGFSRNHINNRNPEAPGRTDNKLPDPSVDVVNGSADESSSGHTVDGESQSGMATGVGMVDRDKETIEDSAISTQATHEHNLALANTTPHASAQSNKQTGDTNQALIRDPGLDQQLQEQCNIVNNEHGGRNNSTGEEWTVQLHVDIASGQSIIDYLPSSRQCFKWNKTVLFGRGQGVDVFINDDHASRDHVELIGKVLPNGQVSFLIRNKSKRINSYSINGQNINDNKWRPLTTGDQIRIASLVFNVEIIPARTRTQDFVLEIISPKIQQNPTTSPRPQSYIVAIPYIVPHSLPNARMPPPLSAVPFGPAFLTSEMVEDAFRTYLDREGYVKFDKLRYLASKVVGEWKQLARALGLEEWQIIRIDNDNPKINEKSYQMLLTWVWKDPEQVTIDNLRKGLEDITVGRGDLVLEYCTTAENHVNRKSAGENDVGK